LITVGEFDARRLKGIPCAFAHVIRNVFAASF
jgi:hypothetical protein